jgi:hypothetical protein
MCINVAFITETIAESSNIPLYKILYLSRYLDFIPIVSVGLNRIHRVGELKPALLLFTEKHRAQYVRSYLHHELVIVVRWSLAQGRHVILFAVWVLLSQYQCI